MRLSAFLNYMPHIHINVFFISKLLAIKSFLSFWLCQFQVKSCKKN